METVNYAGILKHAANSLKEEGRYNQADILRDAAEAFEKQAEELSQLQAIREAFFVLVSPDGFHQCGVNEECPMCGQDGEHAPDCKLAFLGENK